MNRRHFLAAGAGAIAFAGALAQQPAASQLRVGQRAVGRFTPAGSKEVLEGRFAVTEVKGAEISGSFSGQLCGPNVYAFQGHFDGEVLEARSTSKWGPISVATRRVSERKYAGSFSGRYPGKVEIEIFD